MKEQLQIPCVMSTLTPSLYHFIFIFEMTYAEFKLVHEFMYYYLEISL